MGAKKQVGKQRRKPARALEQLVTLDKRYVRLKNSLFRVRWHCALSPRAAARG